MQEENTHDESTDTQAPRESESSAAEGAATADVVKPIESSEDKAESAALQEAPEGDKPEATEAKEEEASKAGSTEEKSSVAESTEHSDLAVESESEASDSSVQDSEQQDPAPDEAVDAAVAHAPAVEQAPAAESEEASSGEEEIAIEEMPAAPKVSFDTFDLQKPLRKAIDKLGFEHCTPIQAQSLVHTLQGHDVTGKAQTGTGKTAAFLITIINDLLSNPIKEKRYLAEPRALVVAPTRELAIQIASDADLLNKYSGLHTVTLVGGEDYQKQTRALDAKPVDIVVATPGRLLDFVSNGNLHLGMIELMVLDEADRMLDMGFIPQVRQIVARTPRKDCRQTLLFSATYTPEIVELSDRWAMDPIMVEVAPERVAADAVDQIVYLVTTADKYNLLYNLINEPNAERIMVFSNRRDQVRKLADNLHRNGISVGMLSGEVAQNQRIRTLDNFKDGKLRVLVATDVAGRGLHIDDVTHVINYTLPEEPEDYVHRIGRTGRAGAVGTSISFACEEDSFLLPDIEEQLGMKLECTHPDERLLERSPKFERESKFKSKDAPRSGGRPGGGSAGGRGGPSRR